MDAGNHEHNQHLPSERHYLGYAILALAIVFVVLSFVLVVNYRNLWRSTLTGARESLLTAFIHSHGPVTVNDITFVRTWMTFDYINKLFSLPPQYLQSTLGVSDSRYPRLTVSSWAKRANVSSAAAIGILQNALRQYLTQPAPATSTAT